MDSSVENQMNNAVWMLTLEDALIGIAWVPQESLALVATSAGKVRSVDTATGRVIREFAGHDGGVLQLKGQPGGPCAASSGWDGVVRIQNPVSGQERECIHAGSKWVEHIAWSPNGLFLAAAAGRKVYLWSMESQSVMNLWENHPNTVSGLAWRSDSRDVAVSCQGGVHMYNARTGSRTEHLAWNSALISLAWSPNLKWVVAGTQDANVLVWSLPHYPGEEMAMSGFSSRVQLLTWNADGRFLATANRAAVMLWDCGGAGPRGRTPVTLDKHTGRILAMTYHSTDNLLATGCEQGRVIVWEPSISDEPHAEFAFDGAVQCLEWNPSKRQLLVGTKFGRLTLLNLDRK